MPTVKSFIVVLNDEEKRRENNVYYPGEKLSGRVELDLLEEIKLNSLKLDIYGRARVEWSETTGSGDDQRTTTYSAVENYLELNLTILSKLDSGETIGLHTGQHQFPFEIQLPDHLIQSFEAADSHVRYTVQAKLDRPWKLTKRAEQKFRIKRDIDLNSFPNVMEAQKLFDQIQYDSKPVLVELVLNKGGFVPGEAINFMATINNQSGRKLEKVKVCLKSINKLTSSSGWTQTNHKEYGTISCPHLKVDPNSSIEWNFSYPTVANLEPSLVTPGGIINFAYFFELSFKSGLISRTKTFLIPVILGTMPIVDKPNKS